MITKSYVITVGPFEMRKLIHERRYHPGDDASDQNHDYARTETSQDTQPLRIFWVFAVTVPRQHSKSPQRVAEA